MKKLSSLVFCLCLCIGLLPQMALASTNGHTQEEAVNWATQQLTTKNIYYSSSKTNGLQCTDLVAYYYKYLGQTPPTNFSYAKNLANAKYVPSGWTVYSGSNAKPGDIAVWDSGVLTSGVSGHTGIVVSASSSSVTYIDYNGDGMHAGGTQREKSGNKIPTWVIRPDFPNSSNSATITNGTYILEPYVSNKMALSIGSGGATSWSSSWGNAVIKGKNESTEQAFRITAVGGDYYSIVNEASGLYLDVAGAGTSNGTVAQFVKSNGNNAQLWRFVSAGNGYYTIYSKSNGLGLDVKGGATSEGTQVQLWEGTGPNRQWKLVPYSSTPAPGKTSKPTVSVNGSTVNVSWTYSGAGSVVDTYLIKSPWNWSDVVSSKRTTVVSTGSCSFTNVADGYYQIFNIVRSDTGTAYNTNQSEWTPFTVTSSYTVTYNASGGTGAPSAQSVKAGSAVTISSTKPTRSGYTFLGWNTSASATTAAYGAGSSFTPSGDVTLYAIWKVDAAKTVTISFNANGGSGTRAPITVEIGKTFTLPDDNTFTRDGYRMEGWFESQNAVDIFSGVQIATKDMTYYARWLKAEYRKVYFNANGGTGAPQTHSELITAEFTCTLPTTAPTRNGYTFLGWAFSAGATTPNCQPGEKIVLMTDKTLYAVWKATAPQNITVSFDANGGTGAPAAISLPDGKGAIPAAIPIRDGYSFIGWATPSNPTGSLLMPGNAFSFSKDTTLIATWEKESAEVVLTFDYNGGEFDGHRYESISTTVGTTEHITTSAPNRLGYSFLGWAYSPSATSPEFTVKDLVTMTGGDLTLYAVWEKATISASIIFSDVKPNDYFADAVAWAVEKDITSGTSATTFSPNTPCTRAQAVTFLWRAAGKPEPKGDATFSDVKSGSYYDKAVRWAVEKGITSGTGNGKFSPDEVCSRAQIVTLLYRFEGSPSASGGSFSDVSASAYYADAVAWGVSKGITSGTGNGKFSPDTDCTRAQIVTLLYRDMRDK